MTPTRRRYQQKKMQQQKQEEAEEEEEEEDGFSSEQSEIRTVTMYLNVTTFEQTSTAPQEWLDRSGEEGHCGGTGTHAGAGASTKWDAAGIRLRDRFEGPKDGEAAVTVDRSHMTSNKTTGRILTKIPWHELEAGKQRQQRLEGSAFGRGVLGAVAVGLFS